MDRRSFLRSFLMVGSAVVAGAALMPAQGQASTFFDTLKDMDSPHTSPNPGSSADLPASGAQEVQYRRRRRVYRRRARRCVVRRNRWGRRVRRCY